MGKITDAQLLALLAKDKLSVIATLEGHDYIPTEEELEEYLTSIQSDECPFTNRKLDQSDSRGRCPSKNIANLFSKERK